MPRLENNGGDVLARGGVRATFKPMGGNVSQEKWDAMFAPEVPEAPETKDAKSGSDASVPPAAPASADAGETGTVMLSDGEIWF